MKVKAILSFSGAATMCKGETREVSPSPVWDDLIHAGYVRVIPEEKAEEKPEVKSAGKETKKNGSTKGKTSIQRKKRVNG